ncbi:hypothetical protein [Thermomonospora umbrina]|uniref:Uncharacterized protein n=1 Tax=Thermomonospora umbrina TaxID=111806 RepID=A0A3D9T997_9ACTN|nr:hypothetical protein [Thermomonospora umbrina]REF00332.1 hypothetical protein DFJ69_5864 [Thermomonospora umbrina]
MSVNVKGKDLKCEECGNNERIAISSMDKTHATYTCMDCGETDTIRF